MLSLIKINFYLDNSVHYKPMFRWLPRRNHQHCQCYIFCFLLLNLCHMNEYTLTSFPKSSSLKRKKNLRRFIFLLNELIGLRQIIAQNYDNNFY